CSGRPAWSLGCPFPVAHSAIALAGAPDPLGRGASVVLAVRAPGGFDSPARRFRDCVTPTIVRLFPGLQRGVPFAGGARPVRTARPAIAAAVLRGIRPTRPLRSELCISPAVPVPFPGVFAQVARTSYQYHAGRARAFPGAFALRRQW